MAAKRVTIILLRPGIDTKVLGELCLEVHRQARVLFFESATEIFIGNNAMLSLADHACRLP